MQDWQVCYKLHSCGVFLCFFNLFFIVVERVFCGCRTHDSCVRDVTEGCGMDRNIGDPLNKAYEAYRNISIENENAKKQLQEKVWYKPLMHLFLHPFCPYSNVHNCQIKFNQEYVWSISLYLCLSFRLSVGLRVCSDRAVSKVYTAAGEKDRRARAGDFRAQSTIKFIKASFRLVFTFILCKLNQWIIYCPMNTILEIIQFVVCK